MRTIELDEFYKLASDLETMRNLIAEARNALPRDEPGKPWLKKTYLDRAVDGHDADDALAMLAVAAKISEADVLSEQTLHMLNRHSIRGQLNGIIGYVRFLDDSSPVRARIFELIESASILSYSQRDRIALKNILYRKK